MLISREIWGYEFRRREKERGDWGLGFCREINREREREKYKDRDWGLWVYLERVRDIEITYKAFVERDIMG